MGLAIALLGAGCRLGFPKEIRQQGILNRFSPPFVWRNPPWNSWLAGGSKYFWFEMMISNDSYSSEWSSQLNMLNDFVLKEESSRSFEDLWTIARSMLSELSEEMFHLSTATASFRLPHSTVWSNLRDQIEEKIHAMIIYSIQSILFIPMVTKGFDLWPIPALLFSSPSFDQLAPPADLPYRSHLRSGHWCVWPWAFVGERHRLRAMWGWCLVGR